MRTPLILAAIGFAALHCNCGGGTTGHDAGPSGDSGQTDGATEADAGFGPPIPGLGVSLDQLDFFLDGRRGILVWVNAGGQIEMLDFRSGSPQVVTLVSDPDSVNPLISPDGTRVVYSQGLPNGPKTIKVKPLQPTASAQIVGLGDIGFWHFGSGGEHVVYCDWSDKLQNGADGETFRQQLVTGGVALDGTAEAIHDRAMDGGPNASLTWLGQVYDKLWAHDLANDVDYPTAKFFQLDGTAADHQSCNGSMAPDSSAQLMTLVIPHDWVRIYAYDSVDDRFEERSRFELPPGMVEWEFPEWSTDPGFFTAVLRKSDYRNRLFLLKVQPGDVVPDRVEITDDTADVSYGHLWLAP